MNENDKERLALDFLLSLAEKKQLSNKKIRRVARAQGLNLSEVLSKLSLLAEKSNSPTIMEQVKDAEVHPLTKKAKKRRKSKRQEKVWRERSPQEREKILNALSEGNARFWETASEEAIRDVIRKQVSARKETRLKRTPAQKQTEKENRSKAAKQVWSERSPQERKNFGEKVRAGQEKIPFKAQKRRLEKISRGNKETWGQVPLKERIEQTQPLREGSAKFWSTAPQEKLAEIREKQSEAGKRGWNRLSEEEQKKRVQSLASARKGKKFTEEQRQRLREAHAKRRKSPFDSSTWRALDREQAQIEKETKTTSPFSVLNEKRKDRKRKK